ncbi:hypothetical protein WJX73_000826 [Symbiochloris irregularis]|uniref:SBP-type domain-containing protein n=1 Tax=Symbiochloris irregularis TaxID=706552 RepID=A0AAW1PWB4_9CHLO
MVTSGGEVDREQHWRLEDYAWDNTALTGREVSPASLWRGTESRHVSESSPDSLLPDTASGEAAQALPQSVPVVLDSLQSTGGQKKTIPLMCQVEGCKRDLAGSKDYYQRYRVCEEHLKLSSLIKDNIPQRFCQQCGRFHVLADFDGDKRSLPEDIAEMPTAASAAIVSAATAPALPPLERTPDAVMAEEDLYVASSILGLTPAATARRASRHALQMQGSQEAVVQQAHASLAERLMKAPSDTGLMALPSQGLEQPYDDAMVRFLSEPAARHRLLSAASLSSAGSAALMSRLRPLEAQPGLDWLSGGARAESLTASGNLNKDMPGLQDMPAKPAPASMDHPAMGLSSDLSQNLADALHMCTSEPIYKPDCLGIDLADAGGEMLQRFSEPMPETMPTHDLGSRSWAQRHNMPAGVYEPTTDLADTEHRLMSGPAAEVELLLHAHVVGFAVVYGWGRIVHSSRLNSIKEEGNPLLDLRPTSSVPTDLTGLARDLEAQPLPMLPHHVSHQQLQQQLPHDALARPAGLDTGYNMLDSLTLQSLSAGALPGLQEPGRHSQQLPASLPLGYTAASGATSAGHGEMILWVRSQHGDPAQALGTYHLGFTG